MKKEILFKGEPYHLAKTPPQVNEPAPDFRVVAQDLSEVNLGNFKDKVKVITTVLSLDTSVCESQLKEFNVRASQLPKDVAVLAISKDLPFAQKRICDTQDIKNVTALSDYKYNSFGEHYGVLIEEMNLLSRAIFIIDKNNVLRYEQFVEEVSNHPNYDEAFTALGDVVKE